MDYILLIHMKDGKQNNAFLYHVIKRVEHSFGPGGSNALPVPSLLENREHQLSRWSFNVAQDTLHLHC